MGKSLAEAYPTARETFREADAALGFELSKLCFHGPEEELKRTENTQPALLAVSIAAWRVLQESGFRPDFVAGHSLGEYAALVAAEALAFADALTLVRKRGRYMQEAVPEGTGAMAAILRLPNGALESILEQAAQGEVVAVANWNSPEQVVIAGHKGAVARASELAKAAGARRVVPLAVSAPFHCPLMKPAQQRLAADIAATPFHDPVIPVIDNWRAKEIRTAEQVRRSLIEQVPNPVRWVESIRYLKDQGVSRVIEAGAGSVLSGLIRSIDSVIECRKFGEAADWEKLVAGGEFLDGRRNPMADPHAGAH